MVNWQLQVNDIAWGYQPFKKILTRDKTKDKEYALNDMLFIYNFADIKSDYMTIANEDDRCKEVMKDLSMKKGWKYDDVIKDAIKFYKERSQTIGEELYESSIIAAGAVSSHLRRSGQLLEERDDKGKPVHTIASITSALKQVPGIIKDLKTAYKEIIKEQKELEGKKKGSKEFGMFEDGL